MDFRYGVALTGGIGCGKSTVCSFLKLYGFIIVDADLIARECLDEQRDFISDHFGKEYVKDGKVDRKKLSALVFSDRDKKLKLENLLHPIIRGKIVDISKELDKKKQPFIVDIPLYFETGAYDFPIVITVYAPKNIAAQRVLSRDDRDITEVENIISSQIDIEYKKAHSDIVIDNSKDLKNLQKEVEKAVSKIKKELKDR